MHSNETEKALTLLTERLERLEKQNRWLVRIALAMGAVLLLVVTLGAVPGQLDTQEMVRTVPGQPDTQEIVPPVLSAVPSLPDIQEMVRTKNLQMVDEDGNVRASLGLVDDPEYSNMRDMPTLRLFDKEGTARATLRLSPSGSPSLFLYDQGGRGFALYVGEQGRTLHVEDGEGHLRFEFSADTYCTVLRLYDEDGNLVFMLP
jgi:hypothetical protein